MALPITQKTINIKVLMMALSMVVMSEFAFAQWDNPADTVLYLEFDPDNQYVRQSKIDGTDKIATYVDRTGFPLIKYRYSFYEYGLQFGLTFNCVRASDTKLVPWGSYPAPKTIGDFDAHIHYQYLDKPWDYLLKLKEIYIVEKNTGTYGTARVTRVYFQRP